MLTGMTGVADAQDINVKKSNLKALYFTGGLGAGSFGMGGQIGFTLDYPIGEFTLRYTGFDEYNFFSADRVNDISLLYGLRVVKGRTWYEVAGGLGSAWHARGECIGRGPKSFYGSSINFDFSCERPKIVERTMVLGLAFQSTIGWRHIGVSALGNINNIMSFVAITLNIHIGMVR